MPPTRGSSPKRRPTSARSRALRVAPHEPEPGEFIAAKKWTGPQAGMVYKNGAFGQGYYLTAQSRSFRSDSESEADGSRTGGKASPSHSQASSSSQPQRGGSAAALNLPPPRELGALGAHGGSLGTPSSRQSGVSGMPNDLPEDALRALERRSGKHNLKELAIPLGEGWMQRAGRGTFRMGVGAEAGVEPAAKGSQNNRLEKQYSAAAQANGGAGPCTQIESTEPTFFLLTYDQNPDAYVTRNAHYRLEATLRCLPGNTVKEVPYVAIVLDWRRGRSTITAPCFTGVVLCGTSWRIEQYADGQQTTLAEVHDSSLRTGTGLSMAAPWQRVAIEVRGDRISVHVNKRPVFGSFLVPPPPDTTLATGRVSRTAALTGPVGIATFRSRAQLKSFEIAPLEGGPEAKGGDGADGSGQLRTPRPPFQGGEPKLVSAPRRPPARRAHAVACYPLCPRSLPLPPFSFPAPP